MLTPKGSSYLGFEYNTDDHMVYAAWMRQAMDGRFFFDNRFTTDAQPSLTIHVYFWVLGLIARFTGIPVAANLARLVFTGLFVPILYRLLSRVTGSVFATKLGIVLTVLGGGVGFLFWHNFGVSDPIDVWQPEAFVFPSMLTNGLFMVSLCLILVIFQSFLDAREGWKPVGWGLLSVALLMNIHSYDVLTIAFAMAGFVGMQVVSRDLSVTWLFRGLMIGAGAILPALWFVHVLRSDPVFQARAATETYSANFRQVFFGYILMFLLALPGLFLRFKLPRQRAGIILFSALLSTLFVAAGWAGDKYFLDPAAWACAALVAIVSLGLMATDDASLNLIIAWAVMGTVALYFPALFQRKLAMGLSVPWAILAALGFAPIVRTLDRHSRNLFAVLISLLLGATSACWIARREPYLIRHDVSNTTVHPIFLNHDELEILGLLSNQESGAGRIVVLAMPGTNSPTLDGSGQPIPDEFSSPLVPDLNPIVTGLAGVYTFAGHWSETPDYLHRRNAAAKVFLSQTPDPERRAILDEIRPDYLVEPSAEAYGNAVANLDSLGKVVYSGTQFKLIRVR